MEALSTLNIEPRGGRTRVLVIVGTRPEAIKLAPVIRALKSRLDLEVVTCSTGQHREMLDQVLARFDIVPDVDLDLMTANQTPARVAGDLFRHIEPLLQAAAPDWVLLQGDTTTTAAASVAAFYAGIRVGHVEAGLRTHDRWRPFPEEINRRIVTAATEIHFAPTASARENLVREGVNPQSVLVTGNTI